MTRERVVVDVLAAHRLTRLVTRDTITRPARATIIRAAYTQAHRARTFDREPDQFTEAEWDQRPHDDDDAPKLAAFIVCPWCVGMYASIIVVCMRSRFPRAWSPIATALALSSATGLLAQLEA